MRHYTSGSINSNNASVQLFKIELVFTKILSLIGFFFINIILYKKLKKFSKREKKIKKKLIFVFMYTIIYT